MILKGNVWVWKRFYFLQWHGSLERRFVNSVICEIVFAPHNSTQKTHLEIGFFTIGVWSICLFIYLQNVVGPVIVRKWKFPWYCFFFQIERGIWEMEAIRHTLAVIFKFLNFKTHKNYRASSEASSFEGNEGNVVQSNEQSIDRLYPRPGQREGHGWVTVGTIILEKLFRTISKN